MDAPLAFDRLKNALIGLSVVAFLAVVASGGAWMAASSATSAAKAAEATASNAVAEVLEGQDSANASRAALCQTLLYDGDRINSQAPVQDAPCRWPGVVAFYPPEVCSVAPSLGAPNFCDPIPAPG